MDMKNIPKVSIIIIITKLSNLAMLTAYDKRTSAWSILGEVHLGNNI